METALSVSVYNIGWVVVKTGDVIINSVSFDLRPGQILGVVGPNGSGKSTLLRLLCRYQRPSTGIIKINETNIWTISAQKVACKIAVVLQEQPSDFALTVSEIVALGRIPHQKWFSSVNDNRDNEIVYAALDLLKLLDFSKRQFTTLSGGERQRVMVARALVQEPKLLILDEPTNHLDIRQQLEIIDLIKDLPITVITALHDLNMASENCDKILLLKDGQSLGFGNPESILNRVAISESFGVKAEYEVLTPSNTKHITFHLR